MTVRFFSMFTSVLLSSTMGWAGIPATRLPSSDSPSVHSSDVNWLTGEGVSLGNVLFPHFHFNAVYGQTSAEELPEIGHHDPREDGWTIQGFEFGSSLRWDDWSEAYGNLHVYYDNESGAWDHEFEELFARVKGLPGGFDLRGGRYLNRFGFHNSTHLHGWDFVDSSLVNGRFLGEDGLYTTGGEASWMLPVGWTSQLTVSVGAAREGDHSEHVDDEEHGEPLYDPHGARFEDTIVVANWTNQFDCNDFHQMRAGVSGGWGDNAWGRSTQIYAAHFQYAWRQNGYEPGGRYCRWRTEAMWRKFGAVSGHLPGEEEASEEEEGETRHGYLHEAGLYSTVSYGFDSGFELGLRGEYVSGIADAGLAERYRISPAVTYFLNTSRTFFVRAQYNYDHCNDKGVDPSVWAQFGINWGGPHVR